MRPTTRDRLVAWLATGPVGRVASFFLEWAAFFSMQLRLRVRRRFRP